MKKNNRMQSFYKNILQRIGLMFVVILLAIQVGGQNIIIEASALDGLDITKDNMFNYQLISNLTQSINAKVEGSIRYKQSDYRIQYVFETRINPGSNTVENSKTQANFDYSSTGLRELFTLYNTLPSGTYEYCISVTPYNNVGEIDLGGKVEECIYYQKQEMFLINLIEPENNAKIYEKNPSLTWIAILHA
jgi:hypothetical protein